MAIVTAQKIGLDPEDVERYESQLVRLNLEYYKKQRSSECPLGNNCADKQAPIRCSVARSSYLKNNFSGREVKKYAINKKNP